VGFLERSLQKAYNLYKKDYCDILTMAKGKQKKPYYCNPVYFKILIWISKEPKPILFLSKVLKKNRESLLKQLHDLEQDNLITRTKVDRKYFYSITDRGKQIMFLFERFTIALKKFDKQKFEIIDDYNEVISGNSSHN
jgi:DNA-binding MarR family transcriptional regulator